MTTETITLAEAMPVGTADRTDGAEFRIQGILVRSTEEAVCLRIAHIYQAAARHTPYDSLIGETTWLPRAVLKNVEYIVDDEFRADVPVAILDSKVA